MARAKRLTDKPHFGARILLRIAFVLFVLFCAVSIVTLQNQIADKNRKLAAIEKEIEALSAENDELADLIKADDIGRYMEKLAVENNGYAYPDERRYYDTSRD